MLKKSRILNQAVRPALETLENRQLLSATLALVNPSVYPASDHLIFNYIQHPDTTVPNVMHDQQQLEITDTGSDPLIISSMTLSGPFAFVNAPVGGYTNVTVTAASPLVFTIKFTQRSLPAHSTNETNFTTNTNGGAEIGGSLVINSNDSNAPAKLVTLAGYWQSESNNNEEPNLQTLVNTMSGFTTNINPTPTPDLTQNNGAQLYGEEVYSTSWEQAVPTQPVRLQEIAGFHTQGNSVHVYWYGASNINTHSLFTLPGNEGQSVLPTLSSGALAVANFSPNAAFGLRVDNEYSNDAINVAAGNTGGGGHHFRFFPLRDQSGNYVPNTYIVAMDYGVLQAENFDFQDNLFIATNIRPSSTPPTPTGLTATNGATPVLTWNAVNYSPVGYNVYSSTSANGTFALQNVTPLTSPTFTDTNAPGSGPVYYRVTAVDSSQNPAAESVPATTFANGGPIAVGYSFSAFSSQAVTFNPLLGDSDATGTLLPNTVAVTTATHGATLTVDHTSGAITYTSAIGFNGTETFTYTVQDSNGVTSAPATVTFKVTAPTVTSPEANNTVALTLENSPVTISVLNVDIPVTTFNTSTLAITTNALHGTVVNNGDGTVTYTPAAGFVGGDDFFYRIGDTNGQTSNIAKVDVNVGVEITTLVKGGTRSVTFKDENGTTGVVTLNRGTADVFFDGFGAASLPKKGKVTVTGSSLHIREVGLANTTKASVLSIVGLKNGGLTLGGIFDASPLGAVVARSSNLTSSGTSSASSVLGGTFSGGTQVASPADSTVSNVVNSGTIDLAGVHTVLLKSASGATLEFGNSGSNATALVITGAVTDSSLTSSVPLTVLHAASWTNTMNNTTAVFAPTIGSLQINGEFDPDLTLGGGARPLSLGGARIVGAVTTGIWNIAGNVNGINIGSAADTWGGITVTGKLGALVIRKSGLSSDISAGSIGLVQVNGTLSGSIISSGNINGVIAGALVDSTITAGVASDIPVNTATAGELGTATIRGVRLTSKAKPNFSNSVIEAHTINSAALGGVNTSNGGTPEGLAAVVLHGVTVAGLAKPLHLGGAQLKSEAALQAFLALKGVSFGDFVIDVAV